MLAARLNKLPTGMASKTVVRRPSVSAQRPHAYDDNMTPGGKRLPDQIRKKKALQKSWL